MKIGVFDSGLGGLTVLKRCRELMPEYSYVYLADNLHVPYGDKTPEQIFEYTIASVESLIKQDCQLIILACNTASAIALRRIQQEWLPKNHTNIKVLGIIRPAAEAVIESGAKRVGVIATQASVDSDAFADELKKFKNSIQVFQQACPKLVPLIETNKLQSHELNQALHEYLTPLLQHNIDTLLLGCTHYELIQEHIRELCPNVHIISEGTVTAYKLQDYLERHEEIISKLEVNQTVQYLTTHNTIAYQELIADFVRL